LPAGSSAQRASYANPALVVAALLADGPVHLTAQTALYYLPAEAVGGFAAFVVIAICYPRAAQPAASVPASSSA
jgi:hypothetical protein